MLNGAPNRRGRPSVKTSVLHSNTSYTMQQIKSTINYTDGGHKNIKGKGTRGQSNLTKSASRGAHSPVRGHPRGSKVVPLNSWGRVSY